MCVPGRLIRRGGGTPGVVKALEIHGLPVTLAAQGLRVDMVIPTV